jgi:general secretion pathway protein E
MTIAANSIGNALVRDNKLQPAELERALVVNDNRTDGIGPLLVRLGLVSDKDLARSYAERHDLPVLPDHELPDMPVTIANLSHRFLKRARVVPIHTDDEKVTLAVTDPEDRFALKAVELACDKPVVMKLATVTQVERALDRLYGGDKSQMEGIVEEIEPEDIALQADSIEELRNLAAEAPIVRLVNLIINRAMALRASDIHIEPFENRLKVRYRIDGVLQDGEAPPVHSAAAVVSRIKIMAKLNIAERRLPQDGRIQVKAQGKPIDLRVSTVPTLYGESIVLRILDKNQVALDMDALGFDTAGKQRFEELLAQPHGIILVTGPTGSGKTTTLYAALQTLNTSEKKILTVEDPVEYQLEGINQIQVKPAIGLDFAGALRSIVRQDPDIIMIGEMRDLETARIAVQSALTGHLVLSTLHTNDAGSSVTRLLDMGIEDYLLTSTLNGVLAQRLVRTLCPDCREPDKPSPELLDDLQTWLAAENSFDSEYDLLAVLNNEVSPEQYQRAGDLVFYRASGCKTCSYTGYHGRTVISELLLLSEPLRRLILSHADGREIQNAAVNAGMDSMKTDGLRKALQGLTSIEEVARVTQG